MRIIKELQSRFLPLKGGGARLEAGGGGDISSLVTLTNITPTNITPTLTLPPSGGGNSLELQLITWVL